MPPRKHPSLVAFLFLLASVSALALAADPPTASTASVEGFKVTYSEIPTPSPGWQKNEEAWVKEFRATLESKKPLRYRKVILPSGTHEVWVEKGEGEWFYLVLGSRSEPDSPRIRAMFRLYETEQGVDSIQFQLKLTRRGSKLKFTILAGRAEAHGNLRIDDAKTS